MRERGFDFQALDALKTSVSLAEMLEIEAVLCVRGDNDHAFQEWYSRVWTDPKKRKALKTRGQSLAQQMGIEHAVDIEQVREALAENAVNVARVKEQQQEHRAAVASGGEGLAPMVLTVLDQQLEGLANAHTSLEQQLADLSEAGDDEHGD